MKGSIKNLQYRFGGRILAEESAKDLITEALLYLPSDILEFLIDRVWFFGSTTDAWAYTFDGNDLSDQYFIFLSEDLFRQARRQIFYTVLHEVGHIVLKHKNSINYRQSPEQIAQQEKQADDFVYQYLGFKEADILEHEKRI